jgi:ACS family hexuronate transporter-like MFS transporter
VESTVVQAPASAAPLTSLRWVVLSLVFVAGTLNFADRQIIALLKPVLEHDLKWSDADYAGVVSAFQLATACTLIASGWFVDRVGLRGAYPLGVGTWSLAAMAHGLATTLTQFTLARAGLDAAETIGTPASIKTIAAWFGDKERSLAMGIVNTAPNIGNVVGPLVLPALAVAVGWRAAFIATGAAGLVWVVIWLALGRRTGRAAQPVAALESDRVPWLSLLKDRRTWAIAGAKLISDQSWWFLLFWAPDFFHRRFGLDLAHLGPPLALVYAMAGLGSFIGGFSVTRLLAAGVSLNAARKGVMLVAAIVVIPIVLAPGAANYWIAAGILGLALAAHQAFATNIFALTADIFPVSVVGSVIGIGGTSGTLGGMAILQFAGWSLGHGHGYGVLFGVCASAYILALGWVHLMIPSIRSAHGVP